MEPLWTETKKQDKFDFTAQKCFILFKKCVHKNDTKSNYRVIKHCDGHYKNVPCSQLGQQESEKMFRLTMQPAMKYMKSQLVHRMLKWLFFWLA